MPKRNQPEQPSAALSSDGPELKKARELVDQRSELSVREPPLAIPGSDAREDKDPGQIYKETLLATLTDPGWKTALASEFDKPYFNDICSFLAKEEADGKEVFPPKSDIFAAFNSTPFQQVKVVLIGQDPYHDNGQAHGLCFSVRKGVRVPPSLVNMYKELATDIPNWKAPSHGCLQSWAEQGILLLNATLTVQAHKANSHSKIGWQTVTDAVIAILNRERQGLVFLLLGGFAQTKGKAIDKKAHPVVQAAHPSPLSVVRFMGSKVFSKVNTALKELEKNAIDWTLPL